MLLIQGPEVLSPKPQGPDQRRASWGSTYEPISPTVPLTLPKVLVKIPSGDRISAWR